MIEIGIIGCGPRGLSALESLFMEATNLKQVVKVWVFEKSEYPGAGPVYDLDQPDSNWLNVSERAIDIAHRREISFENFNIPEFPDFQHWLGYTDENNALNDIDKFPLRSKLGAYLNDRYNSISQPLIKEGLMTFVDGEVDNAEVSDGVVQIDLVGGKSFQVQHAVLCIGHQPIAFDDQLNGWQSRIMNLDNVALYTQPYPLDRILDSNSNNSGSCIAVRGFGLAMIDVLRALTEGKGGTFKLLDKVSRKMSYSKSGREPKGIIPFSLDGLPMAPKLLNKKIDLQYVPTEMQLQMYTLAVKGALQSNTVLSSSLFLMKAIAPLITDTFLSIGNNTFAHDLSENELRSIVIDWLHDENLEHELILSKKQSAETMLRKFIGMATGQEKVSLDFCIGHVWRHCQPTMYKLLSFAPLSDELIADITALDERLKRYSYGPPVDSLQQILALVDVGIVKLDFVKNPDIELTEKGWKLSTPGNVILAKTMINSVLDSPQILKVVSPLPKNLLTKSLLKPIHSELGIQTTKDATVLSETQVKQGQLAVLGRLAKGTLIGVDAIAECFGERSEFWAKGVLRNLHP